MSAPRVPPCGRVGCPRPDRHSHSGNLADGDRVVVEVATSLAPGWAYREPTATYRGTTRVDAVDLYQVEVDGMGARQVAMDTVRLTRLAVYGARVRARRNRELATSAHGRSSPRPTIASVYGAEVALFDTAGEQVDVDLLAGVVGPRLALWQAIGATQADARARGLTGRGPYAINSAAVAKHMNTSTRKVVAMLRREVAADTVTRSAGRWETTETGRTILAAIAR